MSGLFLALMTAVTVVLIGSRLAPSTTRRPVEAVAHRIGDQHHRADQRHRAPAAVRQLALVPRRPLFILAVMIAGVSVVGVVVTAALAAAATTATRIRRIRITQRQQRRVEASLPDATELLILLLHAGTSPTQAIRDITALAPEPTQPGFRAVVHRLDRGQRLADALAALPEHLGPGARSVADGIAVADRYGLPLAPVLEQMSTEIRLSRRRAADADARTLPVRMSFPLVITTLPAFVLLAIVPAVAGALASIRELAP